MNKNSPSDLIRDCNGKLSTRKLMFLVWTFFVLVIWLWLSYTKNEIQSLPDSIQWIIGILGGTYLGGNYLEKKNIEVGK